MSKQECNRCRGVGRCTDCNGTGRGVYNSRRDQWGACSTCSGTHKCVACGGRGER